MNKIFALRLTTGIFCLALLLLNCSSAILPLIQFQDIHKQELLKNRAVFNLDIDMTPILNLEGVTPKDVISIESYGRIYLTAEGFKNLYCIIPHDTKASKYIAVKLKREKILPFQKIKFEWAENDELSFTWEDQEGANANVINKKGKAIK